ncbi:MAG: sterol desaturase family protein [Chitinophagales bacterium]
MHRIQEYFATIPDLHRTLILWGGLIFFYLIEYARPLLRMQYKKLPHAGVNIFFTATTVIVNFALAFILLRTSDWCTAHQFGLLYLVQMPLWLFMIIGLLLMDLIGAYLIHLIEHKVKWMWLFHLIHHTDTHVDTTTANRHHPGESIFRFVFTTLAVFIIGAPVWIIFMYQSLSVLLSQFNHANISLPGRLDKAISFIFVSPNMHKVHHHYTQPFTDSNYGNIFSIWDRLFGTYMYLDPDSLQYGIDTHLDPKESGYIGNLLSIPFQKYRKPPGSKFSS